MGNTVTQLHWSAAARLLDRHMPEGYLDERTDIVSAQKHVVEPGTKSTVIFRLGLEWLALSTRIFQEVAERSSVHKLPRHVGGVLRGLVNVRGELLLCVALDVLLGLAKSPEAQTSKDQTTKERLMVCNREGDRLAFFVSEVDGVYRFHPRDLKEVPATLAKGAATYTVGLLPWKDRTVGCLDDELLFYALNKGFA
jgi:chemotaxis-related protein WspD